MTTTETLRSLSRRLGIGPAALRYYHQPLARVRRSIDEGGPAEQRRTEAARRQMIAAAWALPPLKEPEEATTYEVAFLSGANYWWQTLFCILSLQTHSAARIVPIIHDDGTLTVETWSVIARVIPWARRVDATEIDNRLEQHLPAERYPSLRARRLTYPHLRKLTDVHIGRASWLAVLDSDMLFYRPPRALFDWLAAPDRPCCLTEETSAYGYSAGLMRALAGGEPPKGVNVGVCGLKSEALDWDRLEDWCREMLARESTNYLQEQAMVAMMLTDQGCLRLGPPDYVVKPDLAEGRAPTAALHHFVSSSKRSYFQHGWRRVLADAGLGAQT